MRIVVGVTDNRWAAFLRDRPDLTEANFWQPSPHGFKALQPGEPFLFKTKDPKKFRGVDIPGYHSALPEPPHWPRSNVTLMGYDLSDPASRLDTSYVADAFAALQSRARIDLAWEPDLRGVSFEWNGPRFGQPLLVRPRLGQGHFKRAVAFAYRHRCAVTGSATFPSLEAAHIRPFADGGLHAVSNGLFLRTDVHRLFDRGYLSIDPDLRLRVSPQLRAHGWNGVEFYNRESAGFTITQPDDPRHHPDREALAWHFANRFRAA